MTYITSPAQAEKELARLRSIETDLQNKIIELLDSKHYAASSWRSIYADRLRDNVRPAIRECKAYIAKHA